MELRHLAQQLARVLVVRFRRLDGDLHNLVAALIGARIQDALLAQPEALAVRGSLRNLEERAAIDGGHLDFGAQRRLPHRDGNLDFDVVAFAVEEWVFLHFSGDVEIARRRSHGSGVALARHPQPGAVARARREARLHHLRARYAALAPAFGTGIPQFPRASAARAGQVELHGPGHLGHVASPLALWAGGLAHAGHSRTRPAARAAQIVARDIQAHLRALDGLPEIDVHRVFEVAALFRFRLRLVARAAAPEKLRENVAEATARGVRAPARPPGRARESIRKIEAAEIHAGLGATASRTGAREAALRIEANLVVHLALLRIAQHVIGFLHVLETFLGGFVSGIYVGVVLARKSPVSFADLIRRGFSGTPRFFMVLLLGGGNGNRGPGHPRPLPIHFFLSSTSTNSASTTSSLPFLPSASPAGSGGACCAPGCPAVLYMASASLWLAVVSRSVAELMRAGSLSAMAFLVSSRAASISLASASPTLLRCSFKVFSTL